MTVADDPRDPLDPTERELAERLARLPQPDPSADLDARILAAARAAVAPRRRPRWGWGLGAAAAALLCVGVFLPLWKEAQQPPPLLDESALDVPLSAEGAPAPNERTQAPTAQQVVPATDSADSATNEVAAPPSRRDEARHVRPIAPPQADPFVSAPPPAPAADHAATDLAAKAIGQAPSDARAAPRQDEEPRPDDVVPAPPAPASAPPAPPPPAAASVAKPAPAAAAPGVAPPLVGRHEADAERNRAAQALPEAPPAEIGGPAPAPIQRELRAIRALLAAGEREAAAQRLRALLERHPSVELDAELRQLLELPP